MAQNTLCVEHVCLESKEKEIFIIGGPNGAGKTTVARKFLPQVTLSNFFLNADEISREVSPSNPESAAITAGRLLLLLRLHEFIERERSFAIEQLVRESLTSLS